MVNKFKPNRTNFQLCEFTHRAKQLIFAYWIVSAHDTGCVGFGGWDFSVRKEQNGWSTEMNCFDAGKNNMHARELLQKAWEGN